MNVSSHGYFEPQCQLKTDQGRPAFVTLFETPLWCATFFGGLFVILLFSYLHEVIDACQ